MSQSRGVKGGHKILTQWSVTAQGSSDGLNRVMGDQLIGNRGSTWPGNKGDTGYL